MSRVVVWGGNQSGQLGIGSLEQQKVQEPKIIDFLKDTDIEHISCGDSHILFVLKDGSLYSCGNNDYGQLGHDKRVSRPEKVDALSQQIVVKVAAGLSHSLCLTGAKEVFTWGDNSVGQLGRGQVDPDLCRKPKLIKVPHSVVQICCGRNHSMFLTDDCKVFTWGENKFGQLGLGHTTNQNTPQFLACIKGIPVSHISCGGSHSFSLSQSGALFGWGRNCFGQLGVNDVADHPVPILCKSLRNQKTVYVSCGEDHSAALTQDGGLFTFGAGTFGQLGHGSKTNEILPRKVTELMGTPVAQVACGRRHSVVYVAETGRVYTFGSAANGQLGYKGPDQTTPNRVSGPFVSLTSVGNVNNNQLYVINKLAAGGDGCVVWGTDLQRQFMIEDHRVPDPRYQIKCLTPDRIDAIKELCSDDRISIELEDDITKIFSSSGCLNASFLREDGSHFGSSSKKHGLDMEMMRSQLTRLGETRNVVIIQKIMQCIESCLLPSLPSSPPDVEALRLFLLLPELHLFEQPKYYSSLMAPFGKCVISLDKPASRVLDLWWGSHSYSFFFRLVNVYKETATYILQLPTQALDTREMEQRYKALYVALEMLKKLNIVNEQNHQIIPYNKFYVTDLKDKVNLKADYVQWVQSQSRTTLVPSQMMMFCNYPFTFDAPAKSLLLQTDALMQMQSAIDEVNRRNFQSLFLPINPSNPCLVFYISRETIVQDTIQQLQSHGSGDLKKPLKVIFKGEEAMDEGGVRKEFFMLLLRELLDPKYGMFKYYEESHIQWISPVTFEDYNTYLLIGCLCGLAIYNSVIIQLNFPLALYKKLLNRKSNLDDLKELMPTVGRSFEQLLAYEEDDLEDIFCLSFEIMQESFGETRTCELVPGGSSKTVTKENRNEFVDVYIDFIFNKSITQQFESFNTGFHRVCGGRVLELFHPQELRAMVVGNENYDFHELEKNTIYQGEYHRYHHTIKFFWDVFHDLTLEDKKKFLLFLTGSDKIPILGMKYVKLVIQPVQMDEKYLPVAHTCFNLLDLPMYSSKEQLREKLLKAIQQTEGFGLV